MSEKEAFFKKNNLNPSVWLRVQCLTDWARQLATQFKFYREIKLRSFTLAFDRSVFVKTFGDVNVPNSQNGFAFSELKKRRTKNEWAKKKTTFVKKRTLPTGWWWVQCLTDGATRTFIDTIYILSLNKAAAVLHVSVRKERFRINFWRCQRIKLSKMALPLPELKKRRKKKGWAKKKTFVKKEPYQPSDCESNA